MKKYIKKFETAILADGYVINDIPFTTSVVPSSDYPLIDYIQNLVCNETGKKLKNNNGVVLVFPPDIPNDEIWYTSSDGNIVTPYQTSSLPTIVSNTYSDGKGVIKFATDVTSIGMRAFNNCSSLTSIIIPNSVTSIGVLSFNECSGLFSINIPNSVVSIGNGAFTNVFNVEYLGDAKDDSFWGAKGLNGYVDGLLVYQDSTKTTLFGCHSTAQSIIIPNSVTNIGAGAFYKCTELTSIEIPNSVTSIGEYAFYYCSSLTSVIIPDNITNIKYGTFYGCSSLTFVPIPNKVTNIGDSAFRMCTSLKSITIPNGVTSIGSSAFSGCSFPTINIPNSITNIGFSAFSYCTSLTSIDIPNSIKIIEKQVFNGCSGLTSFEIPNSVTSIGDSAFDKCTGLTSVTIPNSVTSIGKMAFWKCTSLTSISYKGTISQWNEITKGNQWNVNVPTDAVVHCTDGDVTL